MIFSKKKEEQKEEAKQAKPEEREQISYEEKVKALEEEIARIKAEKSQQYYQAASENLNKIFDVPEKTEEELLKEAKENPLKVMEWMTKKQLKELFNSLAANYYGAQIAALKAQDPDFDRYYNDVVNELRRDPSLFYSPTPIKAAYDRVKGASAPKETELKNLLEAMQKAGIDVKTLKNMMSGKSEEEKKREEEEGIDPEDLIARLAKAVP